MNAHPHTFTRWLAPALVGLAALATLPAAQAADVGVSIGFSQPGFYGRVDVGRYPTPVLVAPQPVIISRPAYRAEPVYLWVPPQQRGDWRHNCHRYRACGSPVYFVDDGWYRQNVIVHRDRRGHDHRRDDRHDDRRDHDRGRGHGHGRD